MISLSLIAWFFSCMLHGTLLRTYAGLLYVLVRPVPSRRLQQEWLSIVCGLCVLDLIGTK